MPCLAQYPPGIQAHSVEPDVGAPTAVHGHESLPADALRFRIDNKQRNAIPDTGGHDEVIGAMSVQYRALFAVEDVIVAVGTGGSLQTGEVIAASLFGKQFLVFRIRRVSMFGFLMETLSPSPQCIRTLDPLRVAGLYVLSSEQVTPGSISSSELRSVC